MGFFPFSRDLSRTLFLGRMSESLHMHRNRCGFITGLVPWSCFCSFTVERGFPGRLSEILIMQLCRCDSFTPRGGGQRDRERFANLSLSLQHLSTHSGRSLRRDITANRVVYTNIVCAIQVCSLIATSMWCAAVCVRAGIVRVSVGKLGLNRTFFICADGKKTALVRCLSHVLDYR